MTFFCFLGLNCLPGRCAYRIWHQKTSNFTKLSFRGENFLSQKIQVKEKSNFLDSIIQKLSVWRHLTFALALRYKSLSACIWFLILHKIMKILTGHLLFLTFDTLVYVFRFIKTVVFIAGKKIQQPKFFYSFSIEIKL